MKSQKSSEHNRKRTTQGKNAPSQHASRRTRKDFWNSIADDVASGYQSGRDSDGIRNIDEQPYDHSRGDQAPV